jgi:SAM-dependent methyltransferase
MADRRYCPVCDTELERFEPGGHNRRPGVKCPICGSNARTRLAWIFLQRETDLFDGRPKSMLHVAPERTLAQRFAALPNIEYLSADLEPGRAMVEMDITDIRYPDARFDVVYCSHVLEHVPDDRRAMRELARVLKPTGWAVFLIPMKDELTFEDPTVTDPAERERLFSHPEHVRRYGADFADRLTESGFRVRHVHEDELLGPEETSRIGVKAGTSNRMFHCVPAHA